MADPALKLDQFRNNPPRRSIDSPGDGDNYDGMNERLAKLEGAYDALKVVRPMTVAVVAVMLTATIGFLAFLGVQVARVDSKVDALPARLAEEFRAMRSEVAAQTSAIANSITATRSAERQSPAPIIIQMPAPASAPAQEPAAKP